MAAKWSSTQRHPPGIQLQQKLHPLRNPAAHEPQHSEMGSLLQQPNKSSGATTPRLSAAATAPAAPGGAPTTQRLPAEPSPPAAPMPSKMGSPLLQQPNVVSGVDARQPSPTPDLGINALESLDASHCKGRSRVQGDSGVHR